MYSEYLKLINANEEVVAWTNTTLSAYLKKQSPPQEEVEHILDYAASSDGPKKMKRMSYEQIKTLSDKWTKAQQKKGANIKESKKDTKTIHTFGDGSKIVKLIGEAAYKREGFLMRHCVASFYGRKDVEIYSLRDKNNNPHVTFDLTKNGKEISQLKGKGNGSIHPKYIDAVMAFLGLMEITVRPSEMKNLGYYQVTDMQTKKYITDLFPRAQFKIIGTNEFVFAA